MNIKLNMCINIQGDGFALFKRLSETPKNPGFPAFGEFPDSFSILRKR